MASLWPHPTAAHDQLLAFFVYYVRGVKFYSYEKEPPPPFTALKLVLEPHGEDSIMVFADKRALGHLAREVATYCATLIRMGFRISG